MQVSRIQHLDETLSKPTICNQDVAVSILSVDMTPLPLTHHARSSAGQRNVNHGGVRDWPGAPQDPAACSVSCILPCDMQPPGAHDDGTGG